MSHAPTTHDFSPCIIPNVTLVFCSLAILGALACGRSDLEIECIAYRYRISPTPPQTQLFASITIANQGTSSFPFTPPSLIVNPETHQAIVAGSGDIEERLRDRLADATREACRRTLEDEIADFDFRTDSHNCNDSAFTSLGLLLDSAVVEADDFDDLGPPIVPNPVCHALCLLDDCSEFETAGSSFDDEPVSPFARTVRCRCQLEQINDCTPTSGIDFPTELSSTIEDDFCVPSTVRNPAEYCRVTIAEYFSASIRAINYYAGVAIGEYGDDCGSQSTLDIGVECRPIDADSEDIETHAVEAYTEQNDACTPGCSDLSCNELQNDMTLSRPCTYQGPIGCDPSCNFDSNCDCDILPSDCFAAGGSPDEGVCLPDLIGGADGGSGDGGGGGSARLASAITLLHGTILDSSDFTCSQLDPSGSFTPQLSAPPPTSAVSPYAITNGTSFTAGLHHTCAVAATDDISITTFGVTIEELCRLNPLCESTNDLSLDVTATENSTLLASGTLTKSGTTIGTTESGAPLSVGDHELELCIEHDASGLIACSTQPVRASAPLGSGLDAHGYFAGELAADFVTLAGREGATQLSLTDDGHVRVPLPSSFTFPYYGSLISGYLWIGANGGINTTNRSIGRANTSLPASLGASSPEIAVYWDDLDPSSGGGVYTWFDGMRFIVSWEDVPHGRDESSSTTDGVSVQAHIYESGRIELHVLDTEVGDTSHDHGKSATMGITNLTGTTAVEVSYDDAALLSSGIGAVGFGEASRGCLADDLVIPPRVACTARDHFVTVCTPTGSAVVLPVPDATECAVASSGVAGEVVESGSSSSSLSPLSSPIAIGEGGEVVLDESVHRIRWWPIDQDDEQNGPSFTQLVFVRTWVHTNCGSSSHSMMLFTEADDDYVSPMQINSLTLLGLPGEDALVSSEGDDFIGDGPDASICEANGGSDRMVGEDGDDTLDAGTGPDWVWGGTGDDLLLGGPGDDELYGQGGHDILQGGDEHDVLWGGTGDDVIDGDDGNDTIYPGAGVDVVDGGAGDDTIIILDTCELTSGKLLSGGSGADVLLLPPGIGIEELTAAGVIIDADIETITNSSSLPLHAASCEEPS